VKSDLLIKICFLGFGCGMSGLPNSVMGSSVPEVLDKCDGHW